MDRSAYEIRREQWRQIIEECISSGMEKKVWCQQNGISIRSIYYWQKKFRDEITAQQNSGSLPAMPCKELPSAPTSDSLAATFVDLTDKLSEIQESNNEPSPERPPVAFVPELMISLNGTQLYVCGNVKARTLETVMKVISHA